jgi:hypothetical protein
MWEVIKAFVKATPLCFPYIYAKSLLVKPRAQNDEETVLRRLLLRYKIPNTFVEFGFSGWEFNCAALAKDWEGLLIDADVYNVKIANSIWSDNITAKAMWITMDTLDEIVAWVGSKELGILSIDVDGNDYWFLQRLISLRPSIVIAEYNSSFGLRPITVPYEADFDRLKKHPTHTYFGASLTAIEFLARQSGYSLIEIGNTGVNAFFVRDDLLGGDDVILTPECAFREKMFSDGSRPSEQWEKIKHLPYVNVDAAGNSRKGGLQVHRSMS